MEIEKVDVFRKVLNKQFVERLRAIFIINKFLFIVYIAKIINKVNVNDLRS